MRTDLGFGILRSECPFPELRGLGGSDVRKSCYVKGLDMEASLRPWTLQALSGRRLCQLLGANQVEIMIENNLYIKAVPD